MSATTRPQPAAARGPARGARRPARRERYPDCSPGATAYARPIGPPAPLPLFLPVGPDDCTARELDREPGDEARRLVEIAHPGGATHVAALLPDRYECDCPAFDGYSCPHVAALVGRRVFRRLAVERWTIGPGPGR